MPGRADPPRNGCGMRGSHCSCLKENGRYGWFRLAGKATLAFAGLLLAAASLAALNDLRLHFG
ncbi:chaperonin Cpn60/TCP-1 [Pseudomonas sp. StFLB209]|nr:chaperonin Cpn60/TCP-1 [Pseudomonas sp. StFLB209]